MSDQRTPVGPYQEVDWESSAMTPQNRNNKPNIVLSVADDLGWNELTFNSGGVASGSKPANAES